MKTLEAFGSLIKEEILKTVDFHIVPNTLVLENLEPYPGYHGKNMPVDKKPDTFFFVTQEKHGPEAIFRMAHNIHLQNNLIFNACYAQLTIDNEIFNSNELPRRRAAGYLEALPKS